MKPRIYIDEAWRWPLAWPVYTWLILQIDKFDSSNFDDSKKLTEKQREELYKNIQELESKWVIIYSSWTADNKEIDKLWLTKALNIALCRWLFSLFLKYYEKHLKQNFNKNKWEEILLMLELEKLFSEKNITYEVLKKIFHIINNINKIDWILLDGNKDFWIKKDLWINITTIIDWDAKIPLIWAASIVAKVERDNYMTQLSKKFPWYWIEKHKWYWTKAHIEAIKNFWPSKIHRKLFLTKILWNELPKQNNNLKTILKQQKEQIEKPKLLLHVCCAPDLAWPLGYLKNNFKIMLYWYNPNIHPYSEHQKRYDEYIKLLNLEEWDYEIIEDKYNPKEFFEYLCKNKEKAGIKWHSDEEVLKEFGNMEEKTSYRCDLCYMQRMEEAAFIAQKNNIKYFTTTLLISPKKDISKLDKYGILAQDKNIWTQYLSFEFYRYYNKSWELTKKYWLWRQNYCGCIWTIKNNENTII